MARRPRRHESGRCRGLTPVDTAVFYFLHGSGVKNYVNTAASNGCPDLGQSG